jgi:hypothetical protein
MLEYSTIRDIFDGRSRVSLQANQKIQFDRVVLVWKESDEGGDRLLMMQ